MTLSIPFRRNFQENPDLSRVLEFVQEISKRVAFARHKEPFDFRTTEPGIKASIGEAVATGLIPAWARLPAR